MPGSVKTEPLKVLEPVDRWWPEAGKYQVLPLDDRTNQHFSELKPGYGRDRNVFTYYSGTSTIPEGISADTRNRSHSITALIVISEGGAEGRKTCDSRIVILPLLLGLHHGNR